MMPFHHPLENLSVPQLLARLFSVSSVKPRISLHEATRHGDEDAVRSLIEAGCDLDELDEEDRSALQLAASSGCSDIFAMLLEAGASVGVLVPPASLADVCVISYRLLSKSFEIILWGWLASKAGVPVPNLIVRNAWFRASTHLLVLPTLYWGSAALLLRSHPKVYMNVASILESLSTFKGNTEHMLALFLDSNPELDDAELVLIWIHAVEKGYTGICQRLLWTDFPVDFFYVYDDHPDYVTALMRACGASHIDLVLLLLSHGADPTLLDNHGRSCIILAVARPYKDTNAGSEEDADKILQVLLGTDAIQYINTVQKSEDPEVTDFSLADRHGWPLADAVQNLRINAVQRLLEAGADPNLKDESNWTALHSASRRHSREAIEIVRLLVHYSADVNAVCDNGWTPLGCAASTGSFVEVVEILVEAGAHIESTAGKETTALQIAARHDVSGGEIVRYLVRRNADVNATGGKFGSVLLATLQRPWSFVREADGTMSSGSPQPQIIDFLSEFLEHNMDINSVPEAHHCAIQIAAKKGHSLVVSFLLEHGAKIQVTGVNWPSAREFNESESPVYRNTPQTSILSLVPSSHDEVFKILLAAGVSPNADSVDFKHVSYKTLLGAACSRNDGDFLKTATLLLEHGADPNFRDSYGHLPVQRAAYAVSLAHMQKLIEYGTEMEIQDGDEYGSLFHSLCKGAAVDPESLSGRDAFLECFHFLESRLPRGTVWKQDGDGKTCLHYLAEMAKETQLLAKVDGSFGSTESSAIPTLQMFLGSHGLPHMIERVPEPSPGVFFLADSGGRLAFHIMALRGDVESMIYLIEHVKTVEMNGESDADADMGEYMASTLLTLCDNHGWTTLHFAASEGRAFACNYLLEASELSTLTSTKDSVVDLANSKNHYQVGEYIATYIEGKISGDETDSSESQCCIDEGSSEDTDPRVCNR
ncbi:ankyrin repeat-containing domain protein [Dactylonectria macrodidyma]|uniref:Ankyrin repeat-containing domain protein n=1 Tax=Dactylonectria macrodidyma TaxID=307937 RepID=A0A9P9FLU6_9HYPO|nr:ankyrin repeat-containing domain protein [Dactylonectria macrodidyma]